MIYKRGTIINNRYRIAKRLAQGGFGAVYYAWDLSVNKGCILKELSDPSLQLQRQFKHEAMILMKLVHPNLASVTAHFSLLGQGHYLVMDYIEGEDLASLIQRQGVPLQGEAIEWVSQVADALTYLHRQPSPIIHCDIQPANIRLAPDGRVVLLNLGLMKVHEPALQSVTAGYSPPEQYHNGQTDARTDVYALGATLYTLLTGQKPPESVLRMVGHVMPPAHHVNAQVLPEVAQIIERAISLRPTERYQTVAHFKAALNIPAAMSRPTLSPTVRMNKAQPSAASTTQAKSSTRIKLKILSGVMTLVLLMMSFWILNAQQVQKEHLRDIQAESTAIMAQANATAMARQTLIAQSATIAAQQTATAQMGGETETVATLQAEQTATAQAPIEPTSALQPLPSATAQVDATFSSTVEANQDHIFGPKDGRLVHIDNNFIESESAVVEVRDFVVEATFFNPYPTSTGSWDYGFLFRNAGVNEQFRLAIDSTQSWVLSNRTGADSTLLASGHIPTLDVNQNGSNHIKLICQHETGILYINGNFIAELDLSTRTTAGDVSIATGVYTGDEIEGQSTHYQGFTVRRE